MIDRRKNAAMYERLKHITECEDHGKERTLTIRAVWEEGGIVDEINLCDDCLRDPATHEFASCILLPDPDKDDEEQ